MTRSKRCFLSITVCLALGVGLSGCAAQSGATATGGTPSSTPAIPPSSTASAPPKVSVAPSPTVTRSVATSAIAEAAGWVAYQGGGGRVDSVFLVRADGRDEHPIGSDIPGQKRHPDFSRDGRHIVFDSLASEAAVDQIWVADGDGNGVTELTPSCPIVDCKGFWEPAWSPDGKQIATVINGGPIGTSGPATFAIAIINVSTRKARKVIERPAGEGQLHFPRWSADGKQLVFWRETAEPSVWIVRIDGSGVRRLTDPQLLAGDADWSPDGSKIVFATRPLLNFGDGPSDLYTIAPDGTGMAKLTDSTGVGARYNQPRWSPDGKALLYTRERQSRRIWAISVDGAIDGGIPAFQVFQTHPVLQPGT